VGGRPASLVGSGLLYALQGLEDPKRHGLSLVQQFPLAYPPLHLLLLARLEQRVGVGPFVKSQTAGAAEAVQAALAQIRTDADSPAYAKAVVCRNVALALQAQGNPSLALDFARRAAQFTQAKPPAQEQAPFAGDMASSPPKIDGEAGDWGGVAWTPMGTGRFKAMWDADYLYFLVETRDAEVRNEARPPNLYQGDCPEI